MGSYAGDFAPYRFLADVAEEMATAEHTALFPDRYKEHVAYAIGMVARHAFLEPLLPLRQLPQTYCKRTCQLREKRRQKRRPNDEIGGSHKLHQDALPAYGQLCRGFRAIQISVDAGDIISCGVVDRRGTVPKRI